MQSASVAKPPQSVKVETHKTLSMFQLVLVDKKAIMCCVSLVWFHTLKETSQDKFLIR